MIDRIVRASLAAAALFAAPSALNAQEAFASLPKTEIAGRQIGWKVNQTFDAFVEAVEYGKPLVMVFGEADSRFTTLFARAVATCPHLSQLAGTAVFAYGSPKVDERARQMAVALKITDYPTVSVIAPRTDQLAELHRLEGFFDARTIGADLVDVFVQKGYWPQGRPRPAALPTHYLAYPNQACTWQGAQRLGIVPDDQPPPRAFGP
jgi:hypothetical protein